MSFQLGLTGGIGSGKSTVAAMLARCGACVIDADAVSRQTSTAGGAAMPGIAREFGPSMVAPDGGLNRDAMRTLIFTNPEAKTRLEAIIHPLVAQEIARQRSVAVAARTPLIVLDIPLLAESTRWRPALDAVLVIDCLPETQIQRVMQRSGLKREQVQHIMAAQASREQRLATADMVIFNDTLDIPALEALVRQIAQRFGL